ncbi:hypothetical protein [Chryseobacterium gleum]|uniref:hypothetical protein n=1 Tax=Chryseobacterium gleum TaxID=250 RepID=UPI001E62944F|nr:hypothetical protein [Chryseobacterium gleum]MCD9617910.1 hypothetical protein [Chryseobacterium gleum]
MLFINDQLKHVDVIKKKHCNVLTCYVNRKIYGSSAKSFCTVQNCIICKNDIRKARNISNRLSKALKSVDVSKVISAKPKDLHTISKNFLNLYLKGTTEKELTKEDKAVLETIFNYTWFRDIDNDIYNAYNLCHELKIESCVYCNRLYTNTIINEKGNKIIRPTLDHWYSQKDHPILALSFYNLIPSCSPCNSSVKHDAVFDLKKHIHPYVDKDITKYYKFEYIYDTSLKKFKISINTSHKKIKKTLEDMFIGDIYTHHQSEISDLDILKKKYNKKYLSNLTSILGKNLTEKDIYRILFGVEYDDENFYKRPLSKLKQDILNFKL